MEKKLKILLLEDNPADAEITKRLILKEISYSEIALAIDEETYVAALDRFQPDIILSDHSLPQFDSTAALLIARERFAAIPFIMVTGTVSEEFAADIIKLGANDYILKDRLNRLPASINAVLKQTRAEKEKLEAELKLMRSESNLRAIFENTAEGFLLLDTNGLVKAYNNRAAKYTSLVCKKPIQVGDFMLDFIEDSRQSFFNEIFLKVLNGDTVQYEHFYKTLNGNTRWLDFSVMPVREKNEVTGICASGRDITEKKLIEKVREYDRNNVSALINNTKDLMWSVGSDFKLITFNTAFEKYIKLVSGHSLKKGASMLTRIFDREQMIHFKEYYVRAFKGESFTVSEHIKQSWSEVSFYPIYHGEKIFGTACFSHDITQRKKIEGVLKTLEREISNQKIQEQKKIIRNVIKAQEKEKNHMGQELHDNINQILAASKMHLDIAGRNNAEVKRLTQYSKELISISINEIRTLTSRQVTPIKDINLKELIQKIIIDLDKGGSIKTKFIFDLSYDLPIDDLKLNIYRIVQEQVNNILKYAAPQNVYISVKTAGNNIKIIIEDDGNGFDTSKTRRGIGISNIINRIESFNGKVNIKSSPGNGCKMNFSIPIFNLQ